MKAKLYIRVLFAIAEMLAPKEHKAEIKALANSYCVGGAFE